MAAAAGETGHRGHVAVVVENIAVGVDTRLRKQLDDLLGHGYRVSVVTMRHPDNAPYRSRPGLRLWEYPAPPEATGMGGYAREYGVSFFWATVLLGRLRLRGRIDVLQVCQPPDIYFPLCAVLRWTGCRIVVDQRDLMPELLRSRYRRPPRPLLQLLGFLERCTQRVAHHTITVNGYLRERMVDAGANPERVAVVQNGPVLARVDAAVPDPTLRRGHERLVCWAGKMGRQDRVDLALDVAEHVVRTLGRDDCAFVLLGDGECLDDLRADAERRGLGRHVSFPGWLPEPEVFAHLRTADVGVDTSLQDEVTPVKVMEYMAAALPVVSFDLPETRAVSAGAGVLVPRGDVAALAGAVVALLDDEPRRAHLGVTGRRRVAESLAWERQSATYLSVVAEAAGASEGVAETAR